MRAAREAAPARPPRPAAAERPTGEPAPKVRPAHEGPVQVEIVSVGRDLLRGRLADENAAEIAARLSKSGGRVRRITVVDSDVAAIAAVLAESLGRSPSLLVTTGGLGPATDDCTLAAVARTLGRPLALHTQAKAQVEEAYEKLARSRTIRSAGLTATREKLCRLPVGATAVPNPGGLAPGAICRLPGGTAIVSLPGRPAEMRAVLDLALPLIRDLAPRGHRADAEIEAPTPDEASLVPLIERVSREYPGVAISTRPAPGPRRGAIIALEADGATEDEAIAALRRAEKRLLDLVAGAL